MIPEIFEIFKNSKKHIGNAVLNSIDHVTLSVVECDVSDIARSVKLNLADWSVAFMSRLLSGRKQHNPLVEK